MRNRPTLFRADQSRAAGSSQPISHPHWFGFLGESRMGTVTQIRDLDSTPSRAQADCAPFAPCGSEALETEYYVRDG